MLATPQQPSAPRSEKQQFNVYLPRDLVRRLKHYAIESGDSLSGLVERIFREHLDRAEEEK